MPRADATAVATELRRGDGGDIVVFGSRTMWNHLLVALHLLLGPALLGAGTAVFAGSTPVPLRLLESRVLDESSLILARYASAQA